MLTIHNIDKCIGLQLFGDKWIDDVVQYYEQYVFVIQSSGGNPFTSIGMGLSRMGRVSPNGEVVYDIEVDGKVSNYSFEVFTIKDMNGCVMELGKVLYKYYA